MTILITAQMIQPLLIGISVMAAIYLGLIQLFHADKSQTKRVMAIFAAAIGLLTTLWLLDNPDVLAEYSAKIVLAGLAVVIALLALIRRIF